MIKCLPAEVQGKLRSGVALPSLQQCVEELLLNSIDAGATCVGIRLDMDAFKVQVIDNGRGMSAEDLRRAGNRYHTNKCHSLEDLEQLSFYGFRGEALASVVSLATLVEISSRTKESMKTHVKMFREGTGLEVFEAETTRPSSGTTVTVCNYFHNMPVRRKRMDAVLENERIRQRVEAISLMHPSVSFTLKNDCTGAMLLQLPKARNTYYRFVQIHGLARAQKLGEINNTCGQFEVSGYLGKEGHYNNNLQFLYVNERLLLKTRIHKRLNVLLRRLSSLSHKTDSPQGHTVTRSPIYKRSQDLYGVFIINIKCSHSEYDICLEPAKTLIEFKDWAGILHCIEESVSDFLKRENLEAELSQDDMESESPQTDVNGTCQTNTNPDAGASSHFPRIDTVVETALSSGFVYRSLTDEPGNKMDCKDDEVKQQEKNPSTNNEDPKRNTEPLGKINSPEQSNSGKEESDERGRTQHSHPPQTQQSEETLQMQTSEHEQTNDAPPHSSHTSQVKKVALSDPFIHTSLQMEKYSKDSEFQLVETSVTKRKISLGTSEKTSLDKGFHGLAPVKIRKIASLSNISQSLDQFRRIHAKLPEPSEGPKCKGFNHNDSNSNEKIHQGLDGTTSKEEHGLSVQNPPDLSAFTQLKQSKEKSISAKLCQIRQSVKDPVYTQNKDSSNANLDVEPGWTHMTGSDQTQRTRSTASDWLPHYDSSAGKTVYVNRVTGLSRFEEARAEQQETRCVSDVSNTAVCVASGAGLEYVCYPFHVDAVLPFLPKSKTERVCWSGRDDRGVAVTGEDENSNSLHSMYSKWNNPVFVRPLKCAVDVSSGRADALAVKVHNILFPYRFSKAMIPTMKVIDQVDKKFLACLINTRNDSTDTTSRADGNLLVLMDQHAAHERVRLENLIAEAYEDGSDVTGEKRLSSSIISPPLEVSVPIEEQRILQSCKGHLVSLGLEVTFSPTEDGRVFIGKVPLCFAEKDLNERRRGRASVLKRLVEEYLQEQTELLRSAGRLRATLPLTVQKVLASFACHGAIKFNDVLSKDECLRLVASLSACQLPFQCAHGRPSLAPLVDLCHVDQDEGLTKPNLPKLRRMYRAAVH